MRAVPAHSVVTFRRADRKPFMHSSTTRALATGRRRDGSIEVVHLSHGSNEWVAMDDIVRVRPYQEATE